MATSKEGLGGRKTGVEFIGKPAAKIGTFAVRGDYWTLGYGGSTFALKDVKGLSYIQRLLQHPGQEFHSLDLLSGPGLMNFTESDHKPSKQIEGTDRVGGLGDSGEMLDTQAKQDYKRQLRELNEDLEDQRERGNHQRAEQVESEIDFLEREIRRAVGLGGRDRRAGSVSERARLNVTRAIKAALQKISEQQVSMGELLGRSIRTGSFCSYAPDPRIPVSWRFSMEGPQPAGEPEATAPFLFRRGATLLRDFADRTTFVGREAERAKLSHCLERAASGEGSVVMIGGPAGVGKTRIAAEICAQASRRSILTCMGSCYDREDSVPFIPFVEILEAALAQAPSPEVFRRALGKDAGEMARLMPQLRQMFPDIPPPLEVSPEQSRRILFNAVLELIGRTALNTPMVLLLEDLHWADEGTLSLVNHLSRSIPKVPVMVIGTYRDNDLDPGGSLARTLDELIHLHLVERIFLRGLPQNDVAEMIRALSGRNPPEALVRLICSNTEGNPFFVEELYRNLTERGQLTDSNGKFRRDLKLVEIDIPHSLRLVIGRHLAQLSEATLTMLNSAAVIGRSFTFELLETVTGEDAERLLDRVEEAERAGMISSTLDHPVARFQFAHELVRQAVIEGLSLPRRQRIHLRVANAIERLHADSIEDHANDLAYHLLQAGSASEDPGKTVRYLAIAAKREILQSAYDSAIRDLQNALKLLQQLPHSMERAHRELDLLFDYGLSLLAARGWHVPERENIYLRAHELCQELGGDPRLFSVLFGLWSFHHVRGQHPKAVPYAAEMMRLGIRSADDGMVVQAHWATGSGEFFMGQFTNAHASFQQGISKYDRQRHGTLALEYGQDPCMSCLCYDATTLWILGYADQAEKRAQDSLNLARELGHPFSLAWGLANLTIYYLIRRNLRRAVDLIDEGIALTKEHGFGFFEEGFRAYLLIALTVQGKKTDQISAVDRGRRLSDTGYEICQTWFRSAFADGLGNLGKIETAEVLLEQASEVMQRNEERYFEPEVHRITGELTLRKMGASGASLDVQSAEAAEQSFRDAMAIAGRRDAKMFELRAATSLSRLLGRTSRQAEAYLILRRIFDWFTEGLDTPDLTEAKSLLDSLVERSV